MITGARAALLARSEESLEAAAREAGMLSAAAGRTFGGLRERLDG